MPGRYSIWCFGTEPYRKDYDVRNYEVPRRLFFAGRRPVTRLFFTNIPCDCQDAELRGWIEAQGFNVDSIRLVRDMVAGVSPAFGYVSLRSTDQEIDPIKILD